MYTEMQKQVFKLLLDKYENSRTFAGKNQVVQRFSIAPIQIMGNYESDYADLNQVQDFENQMKELEQKGLTTVQWSRRMISKIVAAPDRWEDYYRILGRKDRHTWNRMQIAMYQGYMGENGIVDQFCQEQIERLTANKKALYEAEEVEHIVRLIHFIRKNQEDILEREMSITVLGDSKLWEKQYRTRVCGILKKYGGYEAILPGIVLAGAPEDRREEDRIILEEHRIYANPSYVYLKGNAEYVFDDGQVLKGNLHMPMAFSTETLEHLKAIHIQDQNVMTVENLTAFNRLKRDDTFLIFLSGYHNSPKQKLIRRIYEENEEKTWVHFGDIDPDGYYILEHLRRGTGIDFQPAYMDVEMLEKYRKHVKTLTDNDRKKAENLLESGKYPEVMAYMLEHGVKLEQEIVSWMER